MKFMKKARLEAKKHLDNGRFKEAMQLYKNIMNVLYQKAEKNQTLKRQKNYKDAVAKTLLSIIETNTLMIDSLRTTSSAMDKNQLILALLNLDVTLKQLKHVIIQFFDVYNTIENKHQLLTSKTDIATTLKSFVLNMESLSDLIAELTESMSPSKTKIELLNLSAEAMALAIRYRNQFPVPRLWKDYKPGIDLHLAYLLPTEELYQITHNRNYLEKINSHLEHHQLLEKSNLSPAEELELICYGLEVDYFLLDKTESELISRGNRLIIANPNLEAGGIADFRAIEAEFIDEIAPLQQETNTSDDDLSVTEEEVTLGAETSSGTGLDEHKVSLLDKFLRTSGVSFFASHSPKYSLSPSDSPARSIASTSEASGPSLLSMSPFRNSFFEQPDSNNPSQDEPMTSAPRMSYNPIMHDED